MKQLGVAVAFLLLLVRDGAGGEQRASVENIPAIQTENTTKELRPAGRCVTERVELPADEPNKSLSIGRSYPFVSPSLSGVGPAIAKAMRKHQPKYPPDIQVEDDTRHHFRLVMRGLRGEVIPGHQYWELLYVDGYIDPVERESLKTESGSRSVLDRRLSPENIFVLTVIISGRFAAGGKPADMRGYANDFEAGGLTEDLDQYAKYLLGMIVHYIKTGHMQFLSEKVRPASGKRG